MQTKLLLFGIIAATTAATVQAQPPRPGHRGNGPHGDGPPPNPIIEALDANGDQEITFDEIEDAGEMLMAQDANGDMKLSGQEIANIRGFGGRPGGPGPERMGRGGPGRGRGDEGGTTAARLIRFDKNDDGKLSTDEVPSRMKRLIERADTNDDGLADKAELSALAAKVGVDGEPNSRPGRGDPAGRDRGGRGPGGRGGPGGPPSPERMVDHAFEFDADNDGQLSKKELEAFAVEFGKRQHNDRPDRGGPGRRPRRPQRSE